MMAQIQNEKEHFLPGVSCVGLLQQACPQSPALLSENARWSVKAIVASIASSCTLYNAAMLRVLGPVHQYTKEKNIATPSPVSL
jgi:hypothetical protein